MSDKVVKDPHPHEAPDKRDSECLWCAEDVALESHTLCQGCARMLDASLADLIAKHTLRTDNPSHTERK